jgi:beta-galactosidase/beta-glucuronidase
MMAEIPKEMGWNSLRFLIGSVPKKWFDIADEEGILIQNEFFLRTLSGIRNDIPDLLVFHQKHS